MSLRNLARNIAFTASCVRNPRFLDDLNEAGHLSGDLAGEITLVDDLLHQLPSHSDLEPNDRPNLFERPPVAAVGSFRAFVGAVDFADRIVKIRERSSDFVGRLAELQDLAHDLANVCHCGDDHEERNLAIARHLARAQVRALDIDRILSRHRRFRAETAQESLTRSSATAVGLVGISVWVLPAFERPRYREEFRAELVELPMRHQLWYACRLLTRAWALRSSLRHQLQDAAAVKSADVSKPMS